jgi:hypothetical protein
MATCQPPLVVVSDGMVALILCTALDPTWLTAARARASRCYTGPTVNAHDECAPDAVHIWQHRVPPQLRIRHAARDGTRSRGHHAVGDLRCARRNAAQPNPCSEVSTMSVKVVNVSRPAVHSADFGVKSWQPHARAD